MQRRHLMRLGVALAALLINAGAYAAGKGWFGLVVHVDADAKWFRTVVKAISVERVVPGSPAAKAGITAGDTVLEVQGITVAGGAGDQLQAAMKRSAGETLRLKVSHAGGEPREVTLVAMPEPPQ